MGKRTGENQDYYKLSGGDPGRRTYARERRKYASSRGASTEPEEHEPPLERPAVAASGAGAETVVRSQKRRLAREKAERAAANSRAQEQVEHDEVERMVTANAAAAPPDRQLPAARVSTEWSDFVREVRGEIETTLHALRELYGAFSGLARSPLRLVRVLRASFASV